MRSTRTAFGYGFLVWLITLVASMFLYPVKRSWPVLFDSIMPVILTGVTVWLASRYFRRPASGLKTEGFAVGILWLVINLAGDLLMFSGGPMQMRLVDYLADIGLTYMIIPVVCTGLATGRINQSVIDPGKSYRELPNEA